MTCSDIMITVTNGRNMEIKLFVPTKFIWMDAYEGDGEWYGHDYVPETRNMVTYGYPIAETAAYISIANTYDALLEQYACVINIPLGMLILVEPVDLEQFSAKLTDTKLTDAKSETPSHIVYAPAIWETASSWDDFQATQATTKT